MCRINDEAEVLIGGLQELSDELDKRKLALANYLYKQDEMERLYNQFDKMIRDLRNNLGFLTGALADANDLESLLRKVLEAMETGVATDYKLKEGFIRTELEALNEILAILTTINKIKVEVEEDLNTLMLGNKITKDSINKDKLLELISQAQVMTDKIDNVLNKHKYVAKGLA
jgi:uncharacterized protein (UPF0332 family)